MSISRALRAVGGAVCAGTVLLTTAAPAAADEVRDAQWALAYLKADKAWQESTGKGVTVAVIDDGVDGRHPDLERNVLEGKDFTGSGGANNETENDHGTAMAGLIAGHGHGPGGNDGIKGIAPGAKILPIKHIESADGGESHSYGDAIKYAVDQGAKVINMAFGSPGEPRAEDETAIAYAMKKDVLVVAASGNSGSGNPYNPAVSPGVLAVGAVDKNGEIWEDSNYGKHLMLTAPGVDNQIPAITKPYGRSSGTSDATAYVAGAAALVRAKFPDLTAGQVANRLVKTAKRAGSATDGKPDPKYGYGIIQPYEALTDDIPAGSKQGPLKTPEGDSSADEQPTTPDQAAGSDGSDDNGWMLIAAVNVTLLVLLIIGAVLLVSRAKRKKREREAQALAASRYPGAQPPPFPGQQRPGPYAGHYPPPPGPPGS